MTGLSGAPRYPQTPRPGGLRRKKGLHPLSSNSLEYGYDLDSSENSDLGTNHRQTYSTLDNHIISFDLSTAKPSYESSDTHTIQKGDRIDVTHSHIDLDSPPHEDFIKVQAYKGIWLTFVWPALAICVPMILLSAVLLYIVLSYSVKNETNIFDTDQASITLKDKAYVYVDFSATKLVFLASFLSTLAPLLAGSIMSLMAIIVYHDLQESSNISHFSKLPTPYQMSLLIGVLAASYEQLYSSFCYLLSSKRTAKASPVLLYAIATFVLTVLLSVAVMIVNGYLHFATQTIGTTVYSKQMVPVLELGKGLSSYCLGVDRLVDNYGEPCTVASNNELAVFHEVQDGKPETQRIAHNTSSNSTIEFATMDSPRQSKIAFLMPARSQIPDQTNYAATTIGIATQCTVMHPSMCNVTRWGDYGIYTSFNCSSQFWGTLGMPVNTGSIASGKPITPYLPFLAINPSANLIYNYFADESLDIVYNTADLNASAWQEDDAKPWSDEDLKNPIFLGFAWRTALGSFSGWSKNGMVTSGAVQRYGNASYADYFVKCEVTSHEVTYTYVNGSVDSISTHKHENGTFLNMWAGLADYTPKVSGGDFTLQDYNMQSVIAGNNTAAYEAQFSELLSRNALAPIGAFTSGRQVLRQQEQETLLVAKIPKSALGGLLACSLLYPFFGIFLLVKALKASQLAGPMTPLFSYWGLAFAAFVENRSHLRSSDLDLSDKKPHDQEEALRLFIRSDDGHGSRYGLYRRSRAGHVTEVERSQTNVSSWI